RDLAARGKVRRGVLVAAAVAPDSRATNNNVILRKPRALARGCLEGWQQTPNALPSFETAVRWCERPPQDDEKICCSPLIAAHFPPPRPPNESQDRVARK